MKIKICKEELKEIHCTTDDDYLSRVFLARYLENGTNCSDEKYKEFLISRFVAFSKDLGGRIIS